MRLSYPAAIPAGEIELKAIPRSWQPFVLPWTNAIFYEHSQASALVQEWHSRRFSLFIWRIECKEEIRLRVVCDSPTLALQFMLQGTVSCVLQGFGKKLLKEGFYELFYVPLSSNEALLEPGIYETLHFQIDSSFLDGVSLHEHAITDLSDQLKGNSATGRSLEPLPMNYLAKAVIQQIRGFTDGRGSLALFLEKCLLELLYENVKQLREKGEENKLPANTHKNILLKLRAQVLLAPNMHDHSIGNLARNAGISATILKKSFAALFGEPVKTFVRRTALNKAHYLIEMTSRSIEDIAEEVGYSSFTNFSQPFRKQFGYTPHDLRQKGSADRLNTGGINT